MVTTAGQQMALQANTSVNQNVFGTILYNVKANGAKGDGIADDTVPIQNAINAVNTAGGGIVYFPPGTYLSGPITVPDRVTLRGTSPSTTFLKLRNNSNTHFITNSNTASGNKNITIEYLTVDGNKTNQTGSNFGIEWNNAQNCKLFNVLVQNATSHGIDIRNGSFCEVNSCTTSLNGGNGISMSNQLQSIIRGCLSTNNTLNGIYEENGSQYNTFDENICTSNGQAGIDIPIGSKSYSTTLTANVCNNNSFHGIQVQGDRITVVGNESNFNGTTTQHMGILVNATKSVISNNVSHNNFGDGIDLGNCDLITCTGNVVWANGMLGIEINTTTNSVIANNIVIANCTNVAASGIFSGIECWGNRDFVGQSQNCLIMGNKVTNYGGTTQKYGIEVTTDCANIVVKGNEVSSSGATANMNIVPTSVIVRDNQGWKNEAVVSATFSVTAASTVNVIIAHGLNVTPDITKCMATLAIVTATDWNAYTSRISSADATNIVVQVPVAVASVTAGALGRVNIFIRS